MKKIINSILQGKFNEVLLEHTDPTFLDKCELILAQAFETGSLCFYGYFEYLIKKENLAIYHYQASLILSSALCHYEGAYQLAYFHALEASNIEPVDVSYKEFLLFFYNTPEKLMSVDECQHYINEILKLDAENKTVINLLEDDSDLLRPPV
ncbi:hypothetical protein MNBD_GAMMA11-1063 [hydrothermal vent metagenome]|uniref:Uncharacterized protein n=1 Tax=hydrothermal vent metagenome TaxID=652676 RepID=A0A3B0X102_9ZZZZ